MVSDPSNASGRTESFITQSAEAGLETSVKKIMREKKRSESLLLQLFIRNPFRHDFRCEK